MLNAKTAGVVFRIVETGPVEIPSKNSKTQTPTRVRLLNL